jgi:hypothetical protein
MQESGHKPSTGRCVVGLILILLGGQKIEEAEIVAREFGNNCTADQNEIIEDFLDAYDQNSPSKLKTALESHSLLSLDWEYVTVMKRLTIVPEYDSEDGERPRTRMRRLFPRPSVKKNKEKEKENDESKKDNKKEEEEEEKEEVKTKAINGRAPLFKADNFDDVKTANFVPYVDVTTDSLEYHTGGGRNLPAPAPYMDVTGIDPLQPAYMGMTIEQWRAHKRALQAEEEQVLVDDDFDYLGGGGDDGDGE